MLESLPFKDPDEMTLIIGDREITMESARFLRTMDTGTDALSCKMPWEPGLDDDIDELTNFMSYSETGLYIGGELQQIGILYNVENISSKDGTSKDLEIYNRTADIIDSNVLSPFQVKNMSLTDRCKQQCKPFSINVVIGDGVNLLKKRRIVTGKYTSKTEKKYEWSPEVQEMSDILGAFAIDIDEVETKGTWKVTGVTTIEEEQKFSLISSKQTDKIFKHLSELAKQRGLLLSCTKYGDLLITKANTEDKPVGTIKETNSDTDTFKLKVSGRERYNIYRALASSSRSNRAMSAATAKDESVKAPRLLTFRSPNNLPGEALNAADWRKNKSAADAMKMPFPVNTWYAPNGKLWEPNTTVTVVSPTIGIKTGFTFLISQVEFIYKQDGVSANLKLVPPTMYTTGVIREPWIK